MTDWRDDRDFQHRMLEVRAGQHMRIKRYLVEQGLDEDLAGSIGFRFAFYTAYQAADITESPIEALFLVGMASHTLKIRDLAVRPQQQVGRYRVDVALFRLGDHDNALHVELDGHDYHERTKEQAERDRKRDRWFSTQGLRIIRFTGREVWRDPERCADEAVEDYLTDLERRGGLKVVF